MNASASFVLVSGGHLLVPADQVTSLLRCLAAGWLQSTDTDTGDSGLDPPTVLALAAALTEVADQIDAECIALMPLRNEPGSRSDTGTSPPS
jgi:hypothetical protein